MKTAEFRHKEHCPVIGLGTFKAEPGIVYKAIKDAIQIGYRHIDCAPVYGNQKEVGQAIQESISEGVVTREQLWITSKLWNDSHAPQDVEPSIAATLDELQLDYLDLYLIHWPVAVRKGLFLPDCADDLIPLLDLPLTETWLAMENLVDKGLAHHIGVSNFSAVKLAEILKVARIKPEANQIEFHPYLQQRQLVCFCRENGIHVTAYSPLGSPDRPARLKAEEEPTLLEEPLICRLAEKHAVTPAQILLSWAIHQDIIVIPKSTSSKRLQENLAAAELQISRDELHKIEKLDKHRRYYSGSAWTLAGSAYTMENLWDE
ncbi:MAG: aldo/keto reductase [Desulfuromonadales bacterium]|nr:aldo/keto reductase [Desulfuromonadales bacterium]